MRETYTSRAQAEAAMAERRGARRAVRVCECAYCARFFLGRADALTCSPACRQAKSRAPLAKSYRRASFNGDASSACASPQERAMRDLRARRAPVGPSRHDGRDEP